MLDDFRMFIVFKYEKGYLILSAYLSNLHKADDKREYSRSDVADCHNQSHAGTAHVSHILQKP